ncbi:MAG: type II secretion system F family protein [Victivallaceae bacterium]|jgi:type IV pilus assembly protein PilC|nr:type II secretion system F family protein [Victivallaceae bacterium]MDD3117205.1 type II secretion system F family protein [Victivallaceae bacterium]MDD3703729.1 type II secretion system F family protein [Victivallaceae bacterium]MDD4317804.1 type II secretion system F family protein [Victivallaceae bacterium]NLK84153.1 type II secretion system F family protein [Lentisphaerota bacterium]
MPKYYYVAIDGRTGEERKGKIEAASEEIAIGDLKKQNLHPTSIKSLSKPSKNKEKGGKPSKGKSGGINLNLSLGPVVIKRKELTTVTRQLAILLDAGLPLIRSLRTLERQTKNPTTKTILAKTADAVEGGSTFSEALAQSPKTFDKLYLNMIRAGEAAGAMESILDRLAIFMEKSARIAGKIKSAMIYPLVVMIVAVGITSGLMIFIVPNFAKVFDDLLEGEPLPALTSAVMWLSDVMRERIYLIFGLIAVLIIVYKLLRKTKQGKYVFDWTTYNIPLFGPIVAKTAISRFSQTLGTLLSAGVPVLNALNIVRDTSGSFVVSTAVQKVHDAVKEGEGIAGPLSATGIFPAMVISMIEVGEETGKLPDMLIRVSDTYEEEVDNAVGALTSMIEPLMIVGLAVIVGGIVIAMFMPMIKIIDKLG